MNYTISVAAATAAVGYDMLQTEEEIRSAMRPRMLRRVALTGSAAAGDSAVELKVGTKTVAKLYNSKTGFPDKDDFIDVNELVPVGVPISGKVTDAAATNPLQLSLDLS